MRRLASVTATVLLSGAALTAGAGAARASAPTTPVAGPVRPSPAHHTPDHHTFVHLLGVLYLKRVDAATHRTHAGELLCSSSTFHDGPTRVRGFGDLKDPTTACVELAAVNGKFEKLLVHPTWLTPALAAPVDVTVAGTWKGTKVAWSHEYPNSGALAKATGNVFAF